MKKNLLSTALIALTALFSMPQSVWADIMPAGQFSQIFYVEFDKTKTGNNCTKDLSGGTFTSIVDDVAQTAGDIANPDGNGWRFAKDKVISLVITLSDNTFKAGDIISIDASMSAAQDGTKLDRGLVLCNNDGNEISDLTFSSSYSSGTIENLKYIVTANSAIVGENILYIKRRTHTSGSGAQNKFVNKISITAPVELEAQSSKTWDLTSVLSGNTATATIANSFVYDNLFFAENTEIYKYSSSPLGFDIRYQTTHSVSNNLDLSKMTTGLVFKLASSARTVIVSYTGTEPKIYKKVGDTIDEITPTLNTSSTPRTASFDVVSDDDVLVSLVPKGSGSNCELKAINISPVNISGATVTLSNTSFTYNGNEQAPTVSSVTLGGNTLTLNTDYEVNTIEAKTNVGTDYTVTVTGKGSYEGTASATWSITKATNALSGTLSIEGWTYGSTANTPTGVTATFGTVGYKYSSAADGTYGTYDAIVNGVEGTWYVKAYVDGTDNYTAVESDAVSFTISAAVSNPTLTITQPETGGTIAADLSGEVASGTSVKLTATPNSGYQLKSWKNDDDALGSLPQSLVQTISMPSSNLTVTAEFEAVATTAPSITTATTWTFDDFAAGTALSYNERIYLYNGLYISGHNDSNLSNMATVKAATSAVSTTVPDISSVNNYLYLAGSLNSGTMPSANSKASNFYRDCAAFYAGCAGTVYVYISGTKNSSRHFVVNVNGTSNTTAMSGENTNPVLISQSVPANSNVYIGTDNGACNIYAIKFVPTHKVTTATDPTDKATVTIQKGETTVTSDTEVEEGTSLTVTVSEIASGYEVSKVEMNSTDITSTLSEGKYSFTMPETTEDVTVTVTLTSTSTPSTTAWTFPTSGQVEVVTAHTQNESETGLYYRAGAASGRHIAFSSGLASTWTFGDDHSITTTTSTGKATLLSNSGLNPACENASANSGSAASDTDNRTLAYTSSAPGTFYVAFTGESSTESDRYYKLYFKPLGASSYTVVSSENVNTTAEADGSKGAFYYSAPTAGTFVFGGGSKSYVYAVEFVEATTAKTLTATVSPENSGTISKKIDEDDIASSVTSFAQNTTVTLTATPETGYEFVKWTAGSAEGDALTTGGDYTVNGAEIQVKMSADKTVMAVFQEATATQYQLTITQPINGKIKVGDTEASTADYDENTEITLTAVADDADAYEFESWTVDGTAVTAANDNNIIAISGNSITVKMTKAFTLSATFKAKSTTPTTPWTINYAQTAVSKVTYGSGTTAERTTTTSYAIGETATYPFHVGDYLADHELMISRSDGILRYADVKNIGLFNNNKNVYGIQNLKAGDVIEIAYNGGGDSNGMKTVPELADLVNVTESSETGTYTFKFNYNNVDRTLDYTVKRLTVTADGAAGFALTAGYIAKISVGTTYTVNASVSPEATGTVSVTSPAYMLLGDGFASGTDVTLKAEPASGYEFKEWKNGDTQVSTEASYTITNLSENTSLTAVFEQSTVNYTMKVVAGENGSVKVEKGDDNVTAAVTAEDGAEYLTGTSLKLTATPVNGYEFVNWTNGTTEVSTDNPYTVSLTESMTLTANFQESTIPAEETVSEETTWTFNGYTTTDVVSTCAEAAQKPQTDKLYNRSATSGRGFTFVELATAENISFTGGDQTEIPISKVATSSGNFNNTSMNAYTAGSAGNNTTPFFAFNTTVAGTCYAYVKSYEYTKSDNTKDKGNIRIYFGKGDGTDIAGGTGYATTNSTDGAEIKLTATSAGTFFIGGVTNNAQRDIYAIRFVPTPVVEKYAVNVPTEVANGSISANVSEAAEGETVTLTVSPDKGYMVDAISVKNGETVIAVTTGETSNTYTFVMPAAAPTITVSFKAIPTIYGTYDFRSFANSNLTVGTTASIGKTDANVMTGSFTGITNTMTLNDALGISYSDTDHEIKLVRGEDDATTGIAIPRGSANQVAFYLYGLKSGEWFKMETGDIPLYINKVNNDATIYFYDIDDTSKTNVARYSEIVSGHTYVASADIASMELYYNTSNSGNIYLYSVQISKDDAVPAPTIGSYDFATGKVGITVNNSLKGQTPTVYYTTNGDEPTTSSTVYDDTEKIALSEATTIKAIAVYGEIKSTVAEKLVILESVDAPTIGDYDTSVKTVAITTGNSTNTDATLTTYYTLDGSTPSASSTKYTEAIAIDQTRIVKAVTISSTGVASDVTTKKITVSGATPATTWDFTTMSALQYGDDATTVYYNGGSGSNFNYIVGSDIHAKMSSQAGDGALSISADKYLTGTKPFAIHDLAVGDKVYITYTGGQLKLFRGTKGNSLKIGETTISVSGDYNFDSGAEIAVTAVDADDNYIALRQATATAKITKIEINPVYQVTKGTVGSNISSLTMTSPSGKTFGDSFARGTEVTLKATTTATGGNFLWTDGDGNTLTPSASEASVLTLTLTDNITVNVSYSNATIWDFSELTAGDITTVTASNGMYYRAGARTTDGKQGRAIVVGENTSQLTWNFPDGTVYSRQNSSANTAPYVTLPGNTTLAPASSAAPSDKEGQTLTSDDDSNNRSLAFTTTSAGTVYVAYRVASGRYANLYFKPTSGDSYSIVSTDGADDNNNRQGMLFYTAPSGGTFFIGGTGDMNVYMVKFEPASTDIYTLTETANPTAGGSVKKEIIYGDESSPSYYEAVANTFLAGTKLRLTPAPNVGYGFAYWGDDTSDQAASKTVEMTTNQSVKVNFGEVKRTVTVASAENGSVSLRVGDSAVELTDGSAQVGDGAEVTVMTTPTLFYGVSEISVTKTGDAETTIEVTNGKFTLPEYDVTVTVTFAEENKCYSEKTWTFETTDLSETITTVKYFKDGLYLRGSSGSKAITQVDASVTSVTLNGEAITVSKALQTAATFDAPDAANNSATAVSPLKATSGTAMLALNTAVKGTLYVAMSPVSDESGEARVYFYDGTNAPTAVKAKTAFSSSSAVYTVSYETTVPGIFFVGGTKAVNIYAAKFVPADTSGDIKITKMSESGNIYQLSNGLLTVTIGSEGYVDKIVMADGTEIMKEGSDDNSWGYFSYNTSSSDSRRLFKDGENYPTVNIVTQTSDMVEIVYTNDNNSLAQTWSVGYIMRKGVSGLYTYAKVKNGSTESDLPEARFVWRPDRDNFNYGYVSDDRQGTDAIPSYDKFSVATELQDATYRFSDNTIYTKYDWANFMKDDQVHGVMSNTNGLWVIQPSTEWVNGGVQKQDLMVHADDGGPVVLQMMQSQHFGAASHTLAANEEKFFGPSLLYLNSGSSKDAMISDAKTMAESEVGAWPYSWFENDDYPQASDRSKVTGTITLSNTDFTTTKIRVILADNSVDDPLVQVGGYQYATDVESTTGSYAFSINNVREGTYALFAYALNGDATGVLKTSRTYTMPTNKGMGTIVWEPKKYGEKLWQIGEADHSTAGFKLSDHARQYGLWEQAPASLTYTVGTSTESDWYYVQPKGSTWTVNFDCDETFTEPLHLTIAVAGASRKPTLVIKMNDHQVYNAQYTSDDPSVYRSATLAGKYGLLEVEIPANNMVTGTNSLTIAANSSSSEVVGLMYDCIKLERPNPKYVVDDVKNWVFGELTTGTVYKAITPVNEEYYLRAGGVVTGTSTATRTFTVTDATDTPTFTFADGSSVSTNTGKYLKANGAYKAGDNPIGATSSAGGNESYSYPMFAFNISESGTVYAKVKGTKNDKFRIYFANGNSITNKEFTATGDIDEITCTASEAGSVFITDVTSAFEIHAVRFVPDSKAVKYELTLGSPENGTITASVGSTSYAGGTTNEVIPVTEVTLTAVPGTGYQLKGWTDGDGNAVGTLPQSIVNTYTMPTASATVTAEFEALPKLEGLTEKTTWLFDGFKAGTILSDSEAYGFNNGTGTLYVSGHSNGSASAMATVKAGDEVSGNLGSIEVKATNYLALAGEVHSDTYVKSDRAANTFTKDAIAFRASRPGTVYALMQGTYSDSETRTFNIYVNGTVNKTEMPSDNAATVVSQEIADTAATVFIAGSRGDYKVYAVRFVPQEDKKVEVVVTKEDDNNATVTSVDIGSDAAEVVIPATAEDGTPVTKIADDVFTEDNTANVSSIDLSETQVTLDGNRSTNDVLKVIPENTLIYVPETSTVTGTNVVKKTGEGDGATYNCENYEVVDGAETTIPHSFTAGTAKLERNFTAGKKCTVCLPYDFEAEGGTFYKFTGISNGKVQMTQQTGLLPKNTPYIFVPESDATETAVAENVEVKINGIPETVNDESNFKFTGTYEHLNWEAPSGIYGFAAEENGLATVGQFVRVGNGAGIEAYRAYLTYTGEGAISGTNAAPRRRASGLPAILEIEWIAASGTTVIREMRQSDEHDAPVYNMSGQRVDGSYKGMVIINGKKVIRK